MKPAARMTSHTKSGWPRVSKAHGSFESIPTLRVASKDPSSRTTAAPKRPVQYADPTMFQGRRLDRRQQSTYSARSGTSGLSGVDQITVPGSGLARAADSIEGSTKMSHTSLLTAGNGRSLPPEAGDGSVLVRPPEEDNRLHVSRRQVRSGPDDDTKITLVPMALPPQTSFSKVSRWRHANFTNNRPLSLDARQTLLESPSSVKSQESESRRTVEDDLMPQQELWSRDERQGELEKGSLPGLYREQHEEERDLTATGDREERATPSSVTPPPVPVKPVISTQQPTGLRHINPHRRPAETPSVSPAPPSGAGLRLNKILWALAPDEHANTSDAGLSLMQSTCVDVSQAADRALTRTLHKTVTMTDLEVASDISCEVPETPRNPHLTQHILHQHNAASSCWSREDRINQWLAECDKQTTSQSLPTHLPDIRYTFKYLKSVV